MSRRRRDGRESAARVVRRDFAKHTKRALRAMSRAALTERAVHDVRKRLKDARASLRLMREEIGSAAYRRLNHRLRDAARPFAAARDAMVLEQTCESLVERLRSWRAHAGVLRSIEDAFADERRRVQRSSERRARAESRRVVRQARARTIRATMGTDGWKSAGAGLRRVYRSGRAAHRQARTRPSVERLHEWRKQAKYLRHGLEVLLSKKGDLVTRAHRLTDLLGEDHDLALLGVKLMTMRLDAARRRRAVRLLEPLILARRARLQRQAFALGRRLYAQTPRLFERQVRAEWRSAG